MNTENPLHMSLRPEEQSLLCDIAEQCGTPSYVYSLDRLEQKITTLLQDFKVLKPEIRYAMKANANVDILRRILALGHGVDVVSYGEFLLAKALGFPLSKILVTVNNISRKETRDLVQAGALLNLGSLAALEAFGEEHPGASIVLRFNVEVIDGEHENIQTGGDGTKFGILLDELGKVQELVKRYGLRVQGLHEHTGSGIKKKESFLLAASRLLEIARPEDFPHLEFLDFGGGFAVPYKLEEKPISFRTFAEEFQPLLAEKEREYGHALRVLFEPGKYLVAETGFLLTRVQSIKENKHHRFVGTDSGFSQLVRPMLYDAYHHILALHERKGERLSYDIVGNICETGDYLGRQRELVKLQEGDLLCIMNAGAYGMTMASEYNMRPLPAEVVIDGHTFRVSRRREAPEELVARILQAQEQV